MEKGNNSLLEYSYFEMLMTILKWKAEAIQVLSHFFSIIAERYHVEGDLLYVTSLKYFLLLSVYKFIIL